MKSPSFIQKTLLAAVLTAYSVSTSSALSETAPPLSVTITLNTNAPLETTASEFIGLSFEMEKMLPDEKGKYYFSPDNKPLIATFQTLGIKSLRVGGNTADRPGVKVPANADVDSLFAFAKAADVKVIYTLRLREGSMDYAVAMAKYIMDHYKSDLACFAIGNEPNVFAKEYPVYLAEWKKYVAAITASSNAPDAKFCGPSTTPGKVAWARDFVGDMGHSGQVVMITQHDYPGGSARKVTDQVAARSLMLSADWTKQYRKFHDAFVPSVMSSSLPYRLEEANSFFNGGAKDVSDTFASALWALDYMYWWASHGAGGINFHTGDNVAAGEQNTPCRYAAFWTSPEGYTVHPIGYGIKAFDLGRHGRLVPAIVAPADAAEEAKGINLAAYAVLASDKSLYVTLINKEHGSGAREANVIIPLESYTRGQVMFLTAPGGDISVTSGVTLGGAEIKDDASWKGTWTPMDAPSKSGRFTVKLPAATAVVLKLIPADK